MKSRCLKKNNKDYKNYGGRGIKICERWLTSFDNFITDMGERPHGRQIERINNDRDYEPSNCRWATKIEQNRNTRATERQAERRAQLLSLLNDEWRRPRELVTNPAEYKAAFYQLTDMFLIERCRDGRQFMYRLLQ